MRRTAARLLPFFFLGLFVLACWEAKPQRASLEPAWSVQLHVHGSFSEGMGSIDSHSFEAAQLGVDAIWWSDHDFRISSYNHVDHFGFEGASEPVDAGEDWQVKLRRHAGDEKTISLAGGQARGLEFVSETVRGGARSMLLRVQGAGDEFQTQACILAASRQLQRRPLAGGVSLAISILPEALSADARPFVRVLLSEHAPREGLGLEQYSLRYYLSETETEAWREGATYHIPLAAQPGTWNDLKLNLSADVARGFPFAPARDNALYRIIVGVEARGAERSQALFDELHITHLQRGNSMYALQAEVLDELGRLHLDVLQHQGVEISYASRHLNEFSLQAELLDYDALGRELPLEPDSGYYDEADFRRVVTQTAVQAAHARGGLISLNHIFGVGLEDTPHAKPREQQLEMILRNAAFDVDILEVGYRDRAGASLADHLWVWDQMALSGLRPVGIGVSDSHGGPEERWSGRPNNFVSWIYAADASKPALLEGLRQGRVYFGDIELFDGRLDIESSSGWRMGQALVFDGLAIDVSLRLSGAQPGDMVVVIDAGEEQQPTRLTRAEASIAYRRSLGPLESAFVRFELRDAAGAPKALSNPLHFLRPGDLASGAKLSGARAAIEVLGLRSQRLSGFELSALELLPAGGLQISAALEPAAASASLCFELGAFGSPREVSFGGSLRGTWSVQGGLLQIEVEGGAGSLTIWPSLKR